MKKVGQALILALAVAGLYLLVGLALNKFAKVKVPGVEGFYDALGKVKAACIPVCDDKATCIRDCQAQHRGSKYYTCKLDCENMYPAPKGCGC